MAECRGAEGSFSFGASSPLTLGGRVLQKMPQRSMKFREDDAPALRERSSKPLRGLTTGQHRALQRSCDRPYIASRNWRPPVERTNGRFQRRQCNGERDPETNQRKYGAENDAATLDELIISRQGRARWNAPPRREVNRSVGVAYNLKAIPVPFMHFNDLASSVSARCKVFRPLARHDRQTRGADIQLRSRPAVTGHARHP